MRDIEAFAPSGAPALKYAAARPSRLIDNRRVQNSLSKYLYRENNGGACLREALAADPPDAVVESPSLARKRTRRDVMSQGVKVYNVTRFNAHVVHFPYRTRVNIASSACENARESISYAQIPPGKSDLSLVNDPTIFFFFFFFRSA